MQRSLLKFVSNRAFLFDQHKFFSHNRHFSTKTNFNFNFITRMQSNPRQKLGRVSLFLTSCQAQIVTQVVISYTYIVVNVAPIVFSSGFKVAFVATWKVSCGELRDCFTRCTNPQLSQLVAKCEQILCMTSCEFDERAREVKICCQSRSALYYSQQQVDRAR